MTIQVLMNGIMAGCIYGLLAIAVALVFGVLEIPQFALGSHAMISGYVLFIFYTLTNSYIFGIFAAIFFGSILGVLLQWSIFSPLSRKSVESQFIAAFGVIMILQGAALAIFGATPYVVKPPITRVFNIGEVFLPAYRILIILGAIFAIGFLGVFLRYTKIGSAIRAVGQNPEGALVSGISPKKIGMITMALGGGLSAIAGGLLVPISQIYPTLGDALVIKAFIIVIMAGMGTMTGTLVVSMLAGIIESFGATYVSPQMKDIYLILLFFIILIAKPSGLFGARGRKG